MKSWVIKNDLLEIDDGRQRITVTAEQVYAAIIENQPALEDLPDGMCGDAAELKFSRFPVDLVVVLQGDEVYGKPCLKFEVRSQQGETFSVSREAVYRGHMVHAGTWYPLAKGDIDSIVSVLKTVGMDLNSSKIHSLKACLALKKAAWDGGPVVDRLSGNDLNNLLFESFPSRAPEGILADLYPYQINGWHWLGFIIRENLGGLLSDEMGLGKTIQVISALRDPGESRFRKRALVVAPGSILENWIREIAKFCPDLKTCKHHGAVRTGRPMELEEFDIVVTSYDIVVRDLSLLKMVDWGTIVIDEAQNIKNPHARRTKSVKEIERQVAIAVTGTPVENRLRDLWSIMDFVMPNYLGDLNSFEARYTEDAYAANALEPIISPLLLRRRMADHARDLPERIDVTETLELHDREASAYESIREALAEHYGAAATFASLTKLRQFCAHPEIVGNSSTHVSKYEFSKFNRLRELLSEIFDWQEKVLVFTSYTAMADRITGVVAQLPNVFATTFDGRLEMNKRQLLIDEFTEYPGSAMLVLNPRAGGAGINLAAANHVIHYNPEWNPALEDQASARAYRRGQQRPVVVRRLILTGTVEEVIDERLRRKREIADKAVVGVEGKDSDYLDIISALERSPLSTG